MGLVMQRRGDLEEAEQFYRRAATKLETLTKRFEKIPAYRDALADATHACGRLLGSQSRFAEAQTLLQRSIECRRAFLAVIPNHRRARGILVEQYHDLSIALKGLGQDSRAAELAASADRLRDALWPPGDGAEGGESRSH
jgi:tetratricopeptide (TPR) repeat protein